MIGALKDRLRGPGTPFALVEGAIELAQIKDRPTALPAAYVFPISEASAQNSRATGPSLQRTEVDIGVLIVFENLSAPIGEASGDDLEDIKGWVRARSIGFLPPGASDPIEHVSGELVKARSGTVWWQETFATAFYLKEQI